MYVEIKSDQPEALRRVFDNAIDSGQQAMIALRKEGDFWSLSVNTTVGDPIPA